MNILELLCLSSQSYDYLRQLMQDLSLTVSVKKLVAPSTSVVCLGVLIDTEAATISIPDAKLVQIVNTVKE